LRSKEEISEEEYKEFYKQAISGSDGGVTGWVHFAAEGEVDACGGVRGGFEGEFGEDACGFGPCGVVESGEGVEGGGGDGGSDLAGLACGDVEHVDWADGASPERVETAAVEPVAVVAVVGPAAAFFLPDAWWLIGFDGGAAGSGDEEAGGGEGGVANHFGGEAEAGAAGEGDVVRVGEEAVAVAAAFLGEGAAEGDGAEETFDGPA
jgi:hypothetical protein